MEYDGDRKIAQIFLEANGLPVDCMDAFFRFRYNRAQSITLRERNLPGLVFPDTMAGLKALGVIELVR